MTGEVVQILIATLIQVPLALVVFGWGRKYDNHYVLGAFLTLIPVLGWLYFYWYVYKTVSYLLDMAKENA